MRRRTSTGSCRCGRPKVVFVPTGVALVYDARGWRLATAPPEWWLEEQDAGALPADISRHQPAGSS